MKTLYIKDIFEKNKTGEEIQLLGWLKSKKIFGGIIFLEMVDSTGHISVIVKKEQISIGVFYKIRKIPLESALKISGKITEMLKDNQRRGVTLEKIDVINLSTLNISPYPRGDFNVFDPKYADAILKKKHLFLRNPKMMAVMKLKYFLLGAIREWFQTKFYRN